MTTTASVQIYDPNSKPVPPVTMSLEAIAHVKKQLQKRGGIGMRLGVKQAGCAGLEYVVDYVDNPDPADHIFQVAADLAVYVDVESLPFVKGTHIEFVKNNLGGGTLQFVNPNSKVSCGCGESFSVE